VIAILCGLGTAVCWAVGLLASSRSSRMIGPGSVLAWVMLVGLALTIPAVALSGIPPGLDSSSIRWLALSGFGNVIGLLLVYAALRTGKVGIVGAISSTEGGLAALMAVVAGERLPVSDGPPLVAIVLGVVLTGLRRDDPDPASQPQTGQSTLLAAGAALAFGVGLYSSGRVSQTLPIAWVLLPARAIGVLAVAAPLAATARLRLTRDAAPLVVTAGVCEVVGFTLYGLGARHGIAVTAVLASQFAALAALGAFALFKERLAQIQVLGMALLAVAVAVLSWVQA
jgi:drug/metabolite transporter (DMT)-like permease